MTQSSTIFDDFCFPEIKSCASETAAKRNPIMIINSIKLVQLPFWNLPKKLFDERQTRIKIMKLYSFECDGENMQNHFICKNGEERNFFPCQRNLQSHKFLLLSLTALIRINIFSIEILCKSTSFSSFPAE